ncbi:MAG: hypothetical protein ABL904_11655 [Hyphomicrobiaceae bacterium]
MIYGMPVSTFTTLHVAISLIALAVGFLMVADLLKDWHRPLVVNAFFAMTALTSITGFMFPATPAVTPAQIFGVVSLAAIAIAITALGFNGNRGNGITGRVFIVMSLLALYLNAFVAVFQAFQKLPPLAKIAPTQSEGPFLLAQGLLLLVFTAIGWLLLRRPAAGLSTG